MDAFRFNDHAAALVEAPQRPRQKVELYGTYHMELYDKDGNLLATRDGHNGITDVGLDYCLNTTFNNLASLNPFFIALVNDSPSPAPVAGDTMASHAGWIEFTGYSEANRVDWTEGAASNQSITNAISADFTITSGATLWGIFVTSDNAKSGVVGTLWSTANFSAGLVVVSTNVVKITYTVNAT